MSKKSPFIGYTEEEIIGIESCTYIIQAGSDIFHVDGSFVFNKRRAAIYYNKILREVLSQMTNGTNAQKKNAKRVLENLKVLPLRIH